MFLNSLSQTGLDETTLIVKSIQNNRESKEWFGCWVCEMACAKLA